MMIKLFTLIFLLWPIATYAQSVQALINDFYSVIAGLVKLMVPLALIFFLWGLAKFILSAGDENAKDIGKRIMFWGIIALFVMVSVWGIVALLQSNFGISLSLPPASQ